ncbi:hypothetical protein GCM10010116_01050 [Microbispora rosea subsp. aerata]|nr:LxmA leader domain family RiPP [Microbispora rosea]GGO00672.1 hypothetical protein GCM10010116_01050 [Microbispora rosea subsp. aerata]GIH56856.1 hypothetical protein Mro02_37700 [Microbispora rosea subsp. aerata]GLJ84341.1 hypothetical protein GCM10017588_30690 [Microbispora rosea subsp. aerata]
MSTESLLSGADAYTTPAEVADTPQTDAPEATPTILISAIASAGGGAMTAKYGC